MSTTYQPGSEGQDTTVFSASPAQTFGNGTYIEVGRIGSDETRAFLKFDVPQRPGYDVTGATLEIWVYSRNDPPEVLVPLVQAHRVGTSWEESSTTWNDQPGVTGAVLSEVDVVGLGRWVFNVAAAVIEWQNGLPNRGFRLAFPPGGDARSFRAYSSDYADDPDLRPRLVISYVARVPNAPIIRKDSFPANEDEVFSWVFSHDDPNLQQTAYLLEIYNASNGTAVYSTGKVLSSAQQITLPANTLTNGNEYQWRVKTWGLEDGEGPYSAFDLFTTEARPVVVITTPASGETVISSSKQIEWDYILGATPTTSPQARSRVRLYESGTNVLYYDSGVVDNTQPFFTVPSLQDDTTYRAEVTAFSQAGISNSPPATVTFLVDLVLPTVPVVALLPETDFGRMRVSITNPVHGLDQADTANNTIYRRLLGDTVWTRVGTAPKNGVFDDYTVAGGTLVEYRVVANSVVATEAESTVSGLVDLYGVWIHEPTDPVGTLGHFFYDGLGRDELFTPEVELMRFAGRTGAVAEFGPQAAVDQVEASVQLASGDTDRERLRALARRRVVICYRDGQSRKIYGVITNLSIRDERYGGAASFRVEAVDYIEPVL